MGQTSSDVLKGLGIIHTAVVRLPNYIPNNGRTMILQSGPTKDTKEFL